jgi:endonuclease G, mitochondrial
MAFEKSLNLHEGMLVDNLQEIIRRTPSLFDNAKGFDEEFLGTTVRLPVLPSALQAAAARRLDKPDSYVLPFTHFSAVMHAQRRLPMLVAVNIDGAKLNPRKKPPRPVWSYDPRIDEAEQPDDSIFSQMVQRGHMAAREFMWWGSDDEAREADRHSFTLTNVCPQMASFNGHLEWRALEQSLFKVAKDQKRKVVCCMGPIFLASDPLYDDLRGKDSTAAWGSGMRIPRKFWYALAWRARGQLLARGFVLEHGDDIDAAGPLEFDFEAPATVKEVGMAEIAKATGLQFPDLV